jgi:site-specific recombinase XerD
MKKQFQERLCSLVRQKPATRYDNILRDIGTRYVTGYGIFHALRGKQPMAHYTLIARINAGDGKFPYVNVQFSKNHRPIPIERATYYLRPGSPISRTPIRIGKDLNAAFAALLNMENYKALYNIAVLPAVSASVVPATLPRKTIAEAAREYIERSRQKSRKTFIGYRTSVNLFVQNCRKSYFDEIRRDDMLDYLCFLRNSKSSKTGGRFGESTVFNYFLKTMVFLNDRGIAKYVAKEDWVQKKDWLINVDKRNKNKKYATYLEEEIAAMLHVANATEEALIRFLLGTGFRIGETAVTEWTDVDWVDKTISVRFKPKFGFKPKDYEERSIVVSDTLLACLRKYRGSATEDALIFPSRTTGTVDKHLDRPLCHRKANETGYAVKKPRKPCHAFRVLYATRRHQNGVDIETPRQELGHSDISTTQIYLRSADRKSDKHRARINEADKFLLPLAGGLFLRRRAS